MHQQGSTTGADKLEISSFHSNELWEPGALYHYAPIVHSGFRNPSQCGENFFHNEL